MTKKELMNALDEMNVKYNKKATKAELELLYTTAKEKEESEKDEMNNNEKIRNDSFDALKELLKELDVTVLNETERRITTNKVMFCKRANNKVRAYLKLRTNDKLATEKNTQYKANVLIDLNDSYAIFTLKRLYAR